MSSKNAFFSPGGNNIVNNMVKNAHYYKVFGIIIDGEIKC
jgi:hypothetical protein